LALCPPDRTTKGINYDDTFIRALVRPYGARWFQRWRVIVVVGRIYLGGPVFQRLVALIFAA